MYVQASVNPGQNSTVVGRRPPQSYHCHLHNSKSCDKVVVTLETASQEQFLCFRLTFESASVTRERWSMRRDSGSTSDTVAEGATVDPAVEGLVDVGGSVPSISHATVHCL